MWDRLFQRGDIVWIHLQSLLYCSIARSYLTRIAIGRLASVSLYFTFNGSSYGAFRLLNGFVRAPLLATEKQYQSWVTRRWDRVRSRGGIRCSRRIPFKVRIGTPPRRACGLPQSTVEGRCLLCRGLCLGHGFAVRDRGVIWDRCSNSRPDRRMPWRSWDLGDGLLKYLSLFRAIPGSPFPVVHSFQIELVGFRVLVPPCVVAGLADRGEMFAQTSCDGAGDVLLHGHQIRELAVVAIAPEIVVAAGVDEFGADYELVAALQHAAGYHGFRLQIFRDRLGSASRPL